MTKDDYAEVCGLYPRTFFPRGQACKPLKVGIHKEMPEMSETRKRRFLNHYTRQPRYWLCLVEGAARLDSNGNPDGVVTAKEARQAAELLAAPVVREPRVLWERKQPEPAPVRTGKGGRPILRMFGGVGA